MGPKPYSKYSGPYIRHESFQSGLQVYGFGGCGLRRLQKGVWGLGLQGLGFRGLLGFLLSTVLHSCYKKTQ